MAAPNGGHITDRNAVEKINTLTIGGKVTREKQYRIPSTIYRNNVLAALVMAGVALLGGLLAEFEYLWRTPWPLIVGAGIVLILVVATFRSLRYLKQVVSVDSAGIGYTLGDKTTRFNWQDVSRVRAAFNASDILVKSNAGEEIRILKPTEGLEELVNTLLSRVPSQAIGTQKSAAQPKISWFSVSGEPDITVEGGFVVLNKSKGIEKIPLNEITGLRLAFGKGNSAVAALAIDRSGTEVGAAGLYYRIIDGYGVIKRALESGSNNLARG